MEEITTATTTTKNNDDINTDYNSGNSDLYSTFWSECINVSQKSHSPHVAIIEEEDEEEAQYN